MLGYVASSIKFRSRNIHTTTRAVETGEWYKGGMLPRIPGEPRRESPWSRIFTDQEYIPLVELSLDVLRLFAGISRQAGARQPKIISRVGLLSATAPLMPRLVHTRVPSGASTSFDAISITPSHIGVMTGRDFDGWILFIFSAYLYISYLKIFGTKRRYILGSITSLDPLTTY